MGENRNLGLGNPLSQSRETVCIDTYRVLDSCRDRDCYRDVRIYLTPQGQEAAEGGNIRATEAEILWSNVTVDSVMFTCGFYRVKVRTFILLTLETCVGVPRVKHEFHGIGVVEKEVVLYGGNGNTTSFRSDPDADSCRIFTGSSARNLPVAVVEFASPIVLSLEVCREHRECTCTCGSDEPRPCRTAFRNEDLPPMVQERLGAPVMEEPPVHLFATIGIFSIIRIERPTQLLIQASDYSIPDKECHTPPTGNPCRSFRDMPFPIEEFSITGSDCPGKPPRPSGGSCGCHGR